MNKVRHRRIWCIIVVLSMVFFAQGVAWGDNILLPITNPSFDNYLTGWTASSIYVGSWAPTSVYNEPVPDGSYVAYVNYGSISQTLEPVLLPNTSYILMVDVGHRIDTGLPGYNVELYAGDNLLVSGNSVMPAAGYWEEIQLPFMSTSTSPGLGEPLKIVLSSSGIQVNFDNVRLADPVVPVPPTLLLLGSGLLGLGLIGRRRGLKK
jgi:hypothetical protein